jgi:hypothetical protein
VKNVTLVVTPNGARINRENSADVLQELGYQPAIIPQIIAAGPKPSFMDLERVGPKLIGHWNGLVVIKDVKGKFQRLEQPGTTQVKDFAFNRAASS